MSLSLSVRYKCGRTSGTLYQRWRFRPDADFGVPNGRRNEPVRPIRGVHDRTRFRRRPNDRANRGVRHAARQRLLSARLEGGVHHVECLVVFTDAFEGAAFTDHCFGFELGFFGEVFVERKSLFVVALEPAEAGLVQRRPARPYKAGDQQGARSRLFIGETFLGRPVVV